MADHAENAPHAHEDYHRGQMEIAEQSNTFSVFLKTAEWGTVLIIASLALLTFAFAMGLGWFAGLAAYVAVGVLAGLVLNMGGAWWATLLLSTVVLGIGGFIGPAVVGLSQWIASLAGN